MHHGQTVALSRCSTPELSLGDVIDLTSDDNNDTLSITDNISVNELHQLDDASEHWPVSRPGASTVGYLLDFRRAAHDERLVGENGKILTVDGYIKKQVHILVVIL